MTRLVWGRFEDRIYETGVDRVAFYPIEGYSTEIQEPFALSGVESIEAGYGDSDMVEYFIDGVSYHQYAKQDIYQASVRSLDNPLQLNYLLGYERVSFGLYAAHQPTRRFCFTYRTLIGSQADPPNGYSGDYRLHLIWNCLASEAPHDFRSLSDVFDLNAVEINILSTADVQTKYVNPTSVLVLDSRRLPESFMEYIANMLYGQDTTQPTFPTIEDLFGYGWTAESVLDSSMPDALTPAGQGPGSTVTGSYDGSDAAIAVNLYGIGTDGLYWSKRHQVKPGMLVSSRVDMAADTDRPFRFEYEFSDAYGVATTLYSDYFYLSPKWETFEANVVAPEDAVSVRVYLRRPQEANASSLANIGDRTYAKDGYLTISWGLPGAYRRHDYAGEGVSNESA